MKQLLLILIIVVGCAPIKSQIILRGNVAETISGESIPGVNVIAKNHNGKLIGFSTTDHVGNYSITIN